jgi:hypothetical protein
MLDPLGHTGGGCACAGYGPTICDGDPAWDLGGRGFRGASQAFLGKVG